MLATTLRPFPAASMNSASIFSVRVQRTPSTPRTASRSSSRPGGPSERTVTSKPSRRRSPASGISRVTRTFTFLSVPYLAGVASKSSPAQALPFFGFLGALLEELPEDGLEDAAVPEVLDLHGRVHARLDLELLLAFLTGGLDRQLRTGREVRNALDVVGLPAG